jgi:hypothetical protein
MGVLLFDKDTRKIAFGQYGIRCEFCVASRMQENPFHITILRFMGIIVRSAFQIYIVRFYPFEEEENF